MTILPKARKVMMKWNAVDNRNLDLLKLVPLQPTFESFTADGMSSVCLFDNGIEHEEFVV